MSNFDFDLNIKLESTIYLLIIALILFVLVKFK
jgi:hypothetical protein